MRLPSAQRTLSGPVDKVTPLSKACRLYHLCLRLSFNYLLKVMHQLPSTHALATPMSRLQEIIYKLWKLIFKGQSPNQQSCERLVLGSSLTSMILPFWFQGLNSSRDLQNWEPFLFLIWKILFCPNERSLFGFGNWVTT
jgi:hypothetical protein